MNNIYIASSDATGKTTPKGAIVGVKMVEGLGVGCVFRDKPHGSPTTHDVVVFGAECLKECHGMLAELLLAVGTSIGKKERHNGIDHQAVERSALECLACRLGGMSEAVVALPIGRGCGGKKRLGRFKSAGR